MNTNKIEDLGDLIRAIRYSNKDFCCQKKHLICGYCAYLSANEPSYFRDHTGRTYLSNQIPLKPTFCGNFHVMNIILQSHGFICSICNKNIENIT